MTFANMIYPHSIKPMTFVLLTQYSNHWAPDIHEKPFNSCVQLAHVTCVWISVFCHQSVEQIWRWDDVWWPLTSDRQQKCFNPPASPQVKHSSHIPVWKLIEDMRKLNRPCDIPVKLVWQNTSQVTGDTRCQYMKNQLFTLFKQRNYYYEQAFLLFKNIHLHVLLQVIIKHWLFFY